MKSVECLRPGEMGPIVRTVPQHPAMSALKKSPK